MILLVEIFRFWFERGLVYCRLFRLIILRPDAIRDWRDPPICWRAVLATVIFSACFADFFWLQLLLTLVFPEPISHAQSFSLRAREICVLMAEQLFQYLQQGLHNRCLFVCSVRKNEALIEMLDCCSMPPYQIIFWNFKLTITFPVPVKGISFPVSFLNSTWMFWMLFDNIGL